ncbi:uncharacterized protein LOC120280675 isoform X1 [Dioscorea cayenensis subsp. rotundata]|uniref:Uncharacterized protein LOC120280675 isoform X1 n=1 Tax=Dioscorea cayennensis subsp. rotundata TaxID=55577 RepID=A0AB40CWF7_DIOCR|nr:uncharacterized protein LOC120280675 isoform X1 [Dioscorea cayenensis subsp. rotundata]XP_039143526.1 uncharacterized protein LOC120280675 isoform X1 [Dioscorea cayenensis subsp. rotundata]XP_039143527.1 uncharacterized protein LOC120280675 isoform X1 [Dioscorea cayenensis subsp. rotundata]XP_039143528.1 uncharacterized protein LOC120280675 isoform X1 [Dioscorea cayenensis subsp. rotundata]XP_039143529.1 uncharacterized protein LOC120280675 isoform X1 [Dioscorea cayenensis subsp. rotundata]
MEGGTSKAATKRGTPNKHWKPDFDNVLIPVLVEQVRQGLKCDKSFKRAAFGHAASAVNARFNTNFTPENVENHYRTLKVRYMEIKKARDLSGAGWDDENKVIILNPLVAFKYTEAHPGAKPFINKPIENYEGLRIIFGEDSATGSYAASLFSDFADKSENEGTDNDNGEPDPIDIASDEEGNNGNSTPVGSNPAPSSRVRSQRNSKGPKSPSMMGDVLKVVDKMANAIQNPTHWTEILYERVMGVEGSPSMSLLRYLIIFSLGKLNLRASW